MGVLIYNHSQKESQNQLQVIVLIIFEATVKLTEYSNNVTGPLLSGIFYRVTSKKIRISLYSGRYLESS